MRNKFFFIALIFQFLIMVCIIASAEQEIRLGTGVDPDIYDDKVVWSSNGSIHLYDITSRTDTRLNSSSASYPAIYEDKIVWLDNSSENPTLCVYNISTGGKFHITKNVTGGDTYANGDTIYVLGGSQPAIYGNIIVWQDYVDNENPDKRACNVYMYDLSSFTQTKISNYGLLYGRPDIYGDRIVWINDSGISGEGGPIWMYNISTGNKTEIEEDYSYDCAIYGDTFASNVYALDYCISVHNLSTNEINVVNPPSFDPDIYMDKVVWEDERNCMSDIYMCNLSTTNETHISTANETRISTSGSARNPSIYGDRIVWQDRRTNQSAVYMYDLSAEPIKPNASFTANITSGASPLTVLFTDTSTGGTPENWYWDFGDGIRSKHAHTAIHTFRKAGKYDVSLTVTNAAGSETRTVKRYVTVSR